MRHPAIFGQCEIQEMRGKCQQKVANGQLGYTFYGSAFAAICDEGRVVSRVVIAMRKTDIVQIICNFRTVHIDSYFYPLQDYLHLNEITVLTI